MGELSMDNLDVDERPLSEIDPQLWAKMSPALRKQFEKYQPKPVTAAPKAQLSPAAQAERDYVLGGDKYIPTRSEINNFTMEQHIRWSEAGGLERPDDPTPEQLAAAEAKAQAAKAEIELLEAADDDTYRQIRAEQDALHEGLPHEVISKP